MTAVLHFASFFFAVLHGVLLQSSQHIYRRYSDRLISQNASKLESMPDVKSLLPGRAFRSEHAQLRPEPHSIASHGPAPMDPLQRRSTSAAVPQRTQPGEDLDELFGSMDLEDLTESSDDEALLDRHGDLCAGNVPTSAAPLS
jgi:hypothetical protein